MKGGKLFRAVHECQKWLDTRTDDVTAVARDADEAFVIFHPCRTLRLRSRRQIGYYLLGGDLKNLSLDFYFLRNIIFIFFSTFSFFFLNLLSLDTQGKYLGNNESIAIHLRLKCC